MRSRTLLLAGLVVASAIAASCSDSGDDAAYGGLPAMVDVVALGGSNIGGFGVGTTRAYPAVYARSLAEEAGVGTTCQAHHTLDDMRMRSLTTWNELLATDEEIRSDLGSAEVVIMEIGIHTILLECGLYRDWTLDCLTSVAAAMSDEYEQLFRAVQELAADGTIVMALNQGLPRPTSEHWRDHPDWPAMKAEAFEVWWDSIDNAAAAHNAIVIDTAHMFGDGDPEEFGISPDYTQPDNVHFNHDGHRLFADLLLSADGIGPGA